MTVEPRPYDVLKRALDFVGAALSLIVLSPALIITYSIVFVALGRPCIFAQQRPGRNGRPFRLLKFRTMRPFDAAKGWVSNADRMTRVGGLLRATSLDELPSIWNILRGDMSFVGPRPLRMSYLSRYSSDQARRHSVRPGLTGLAQVRGRNALAWDDRLQLDQEYVAKRSFALDAWILLATIRTVLVRSGISDGEDATMSEFFGPERTNRVRLVDLEADHLATRVAWLTDDRVRRGISISFQPELSRMREWFSGVAEDAYRSDWVGLDITTNQPVSMCGLLHSASGAASLYIYVDPDSHGRGYGRETMTLLISRARRAGVTLLELETPASNLAAQRMYLSLGFTVAARTEGDRKLIMTMPISSGHDDA
ncbi:GNAT family N-acetyltransferase [Microbacterium sp. NPDC089987]|uniref:GNAT family N-acetyltransferase n=1 Tax=Microbacterium sp. NPDC089987 TaxID=3364202 RepID=UPI0037FCF551